MTKILILGGYGFLGTNINNVFSQDNNYIIHNASRRTGCDATNYNSIKSVIQTTSPDIIINCSANVGSVNYVTQFAANVINDNLQISLNLYKAVSEINNNILIVNPLANCSYPSDLSIQCESDWWNGSMHTSVESFGMSKKALYTISNCYNRQFNIHTINLMLGGGFGEYDHTEEHKTHAMNGIIIRMIKAKNANADEFVVWGSGKPIREWVYMPDVAKLIKFIIDNKQFNIPNPLNVAQQCGLTISDIAVLIKNKLSYNGIIKYDTTMQDGAPIKILDATLFKQTFPEFAFTNFDTALKNTISYYSKIL